MIFKVDSLTDSTIQLKIVSIILGLIVVILAAVGSCGYSNDLFFLVTIIVCFCLSFLHLLCTFLDVFKINCTSRGMDFIYHVVGGIIIIIAAITLLSSTSPSTCGVMEKTSAASIGILNAFVYLYISWMILQQLRNRDSMPLLPLYLFCVCSRTPVDLPLAKDSSPVHSRTQTPKSATVSHIQPLQQQKPELFIVRTKTPPTVESS